VIGVATLPVAWFVGVRLAGADRDRGRWTGAALLLLCASSPFAIRYSTEARMYVLVIALVFLGTLVTLRAIERPTVGRLACVSAVVAALLYTHYWAFYLLAVVAGLFAWSAVRRSPAVPAGRVLAALAVGAVGLAPWVPALRYQLEHTGTPWAATTLSPVNLVSTMSQFSGGRWFIGRVLLVVLSAAVIVAAIQWARTARGTGAPATPSVGWVFVVGGGTLLLGLVASYLAGTTYQTRYAAVVLPFVLMAAALGITSLPSQRARGAVLVAVTVIGLVGGWRVLRIERTQAGEVAAAVLRDAEPGDVVAYCPDQLGPAVSRVLAGPRGVRQHTFPGPWAPARVDWVDYERRVRAADPGAFARDLVRRAGSGTVWLVWASGYRPYDLRCEEIITALDTARGPGEPVVSADADIFERMGVVRFEG
jgi:hypothetical protein